MAKLDDFESVFRSAVKDPFHFAPPAVHSALLLSDAPGADNRNLASALSGFLASGHGEIAVDLAEFAREDPISSVLERIAMTSCDLIVCFRHLLGHGKGLRHSLGSAVDTLTQELAIPVLLLPDREQLDFEAHLGNTSRVLVITDHLTGDDRLVNWAAYFCQNGGSLFLAHIEDELTFRHYSDALSKISGIDTDATLERLQSKLLQMPSDYISTVEDVLREHEFDEHIESIVKMGRAVGDFKAIVEERNVELVVMNTRDEDQLAMAGMTYALAVELRDRPLLLL